MPYLNQSFVPAVTVAALLATALTTGCAAKLIAATDRTVMVNAAREDAAGAMQLASQACAARSLSARVKSLPSDDRTWVFDCIP